MFVNRTAGASPYTNSILSKNIYSFLATTSSQSRVHPLSHEVVLDVGVKLQKREADRLYLVRRSKRECDYFHAICTPLCYVRG